jgi:AraC-like DNA-binding protein
MTARAPTRLDESDIAGGVTSRALPIARELEADVESIAVVTGTSAPRVFLPDARARLLVLADDKTYVVGPRATALRKSGAAGDAVAIRLSLGAIPALFGISTAEIAGSIVSLEAIAPELARAGNLERALIDLPRRSHDRGLLHHASRLLESNRRVSNIASRLGTSDRQLRRVFDHAAGMSPKAFARIARLRRAVALSRRGLEWSRVALDAGYFDQAHMIGEFHRLTGSTPAALCRELSAARGT